jgi:hypothetical protein
MGNDSIYVRQAIFPPRIQNFACLAAFGAYDVRLWSIHQIGSEVNIEVIGRLNKG